MWIVKMRSRPTEPFPQGASYVAGLRPLSVRGRNVTEQSVCASSKRAPFY
jgi:hypothetical protein